MRGKISAYQLSVHQPTVLIINFLLIPRLLHYPDDLKDKTGNNEDRRNGDPRSTVHLIGVKHFRVAALSACHQEEAQGKAGKPRKHPYIIFLSE